MSAAAAAAGEGVSRRVALHPLAIVGVSDHYSRVEGGSAIQDGSRLVIGLLFGKQDGSESCIYDALELIYDSEGRVDQSFMKKQTELYTAVYKDREVLAWYAVCSSAGGEHVALHRDFVAYNDSSPLLFLMMDPSPSNDDSKDLPITIFEYEEANPQRSATLVSLPFSLETFQAEQISMEQVASPSSIDALDSHIETVDSSLKTLRRRVAVMTEYLDQVSSGTRKDVDHDLLRQIANLCDQLPDASSSKNDDDDLVDYNDSLAVAYLATLTKSAASISQLTDNFLFIHHSGGGGGGGGPSPSSSTPPPPPASTAAPKVLI